MRLSVKIEKEAQRVYDLRDEVPSSDVLTWRELDRIASRLSRLSVKLDNSRSGFYEFVLLEGDSFTSSHPVKPKRKANDED